MARIDSMFGELALWRSIPRIEKIKAEPRKKRAYTRRQKVETLPVLGVTRVTVRSEGHCPRCGKPSDQAVYFGKRQHPHCKACKREYMREWRKANPLSAADRIKDKARSLAGVYLRRGKIKREGCQKCGADKAQMHHHDYSKPLEVEWLCRPCHLGEHYGPESFRSHVPGIQTNGSN